MCFTGRAFLASLTSSFSFNDPPTTDIYTLSLHDALPIFTLTCATQMPHATRTIIADLIEMPESDLRRSEEHTSELQSHSDLVCRLLLEKKKKKQEMDSGLGSIDNASIATHTLQEP